MCGGPSDGDGDGYEPSPYPVSILPRVRYGKTRPKIETVDVPPSPLEISEETVQEDVVPAGEDEEHSDDDDAICKPSSAAIVEVPGSTRRRRRGKDTTSSAPSTQSKAKIVEVIGEDASPEPKAAQTSSNCGQDHACATCNNNVARYTCPKCGAPYCSVACYKIHDGTSTDAASGGNGKVCTESFYKDRVLGMYGTGEDGKKLRGILTRMHRDINANLDDAERREESLSGMLQEGDSKMGVAGDMRSEIEDNVQTHQSSALTVAADSAEILSDEDLAEFADYVLQMEDADDDGPGNREILESIPPHLFHAFECALAAADEASDSAVPVETEASGRDEMRSQKAGREAKQYTLWWVPGEAGPSKNDKLHTSGEPTLDERILLLPPLPKARSSSDVPLSYNILEVLYAAIFALRIKCNAPAGSRDAAEIVDEAALLLSQSLVLSQDARYDSVVGVMMACSERLVENKRVLPLSLLKRDGKIMTWDSLALDVATLSYNRRCVLRMLFDALDICQLGAGGIKSQLKQIKAKHRGDPERMERAKRELEETRKKYKLASKKVEYFLSWSSCVWTPQMGQELSEEVRAYVADWKLEVQTKESSVEKLIRGIHSGGGEGCAGLQMGGLLDIGGAGQPPPSLMGDQMVSISTVRRKA